MEKSTLPAHLDKNRIKYVERHGAEMAIERPDDPVAEQGDEPERLSDPQFAIEVTELLVRYLEP